MLLVLTQHLEQHQPLLPQLQKREIAYMVFQTVPEIQQWLEINHDPTGLIVDCIEDAFESFLIRFTLQYTRTPILLLKDQPVRQLELRLLVFTSRITLDNQKASGGRILLIDDSRLVRTTYRRIMEADGFLVDTAGHPDEGFEMAQSQQYDLAIIDYYMPGINGAELCQRLGEEEKTSELLRAVLTAEYNPSIVKACLAAGARECLFKNESHALFLSRIKALYRSVQRRIQLERERTRLIGLLQSVPEGVYGVTGDGRIQFVNPATVKLLGRSVVDLLGRRPHQCIHPVDAGGQPTTEDICYLQQAYALQDELREWRTLFSRADGSLFMVECNVTPLGAPGTSEGSVVVFRDISEQQRLEQNWQWQLSHDHLTGLLNRSAFEEQLQRELAYLSRQKQVRQPSLLFFIDLDRFKQVNDELGHAAGDQLLINLAEQLKQQGRQSDHIARLSGDEFAVLLSGVQQEHIESLAEKYRRIFEETRLHWEGQEHQVTGSLGVAILDQTSGSMNEMLSRADTACQQAKLKGRNQWFLYNTAEGAVNLQGDWQERIKRGLSQGGFLLLQQGVYSARDTSQRVGRECFARLREESSLLTPSLFLSKAQRYGLAADLDRYLIGMLAAQCRQLSLPQDSWISLNLTTDTIGGERFSEELKLIWQESDLAPERLVIEVSESELFKLPNWKQALQDLKTCGFRLALDHFGLNTASILNLSSLPIDMVKLDPSLTGTLSTDLARRNLIDAIVETAHLYKIQVAACHVESGVILDLLQARDVDLVQGHYLGKPSGL